MQDREGRCQLLRYKCRVHKRGDCASEKISSIFRKKAGDSVFKSHSSVYFQSFKRGCIEDMELYRVRDAWIVSQEQD